MHHVWLVPVLVALAFPAMAGTKEEDFDRFMTLSGYEEGVRMEMQPTIDRSKRQLAETIRPKLLQSGKSPEETAEIIHVFQDELQKSLEKFPEVIRQRMRPTWLEIFTHDDIKAMIAFYETPVGQKYVREYPKLLQKTDKISIHTFDELTHEAVDRARLMLLESGIRLE